MWIHVPSTLLASVQDTQESNLDSEKLSQLEQSAMWKSKFLQQRSWQSVWKRDTSIKLLSGLTSKPSTLNHGVEKWISSLGDSHVNPFQTQVESSEQMTRETYGLTQPDLFGGLGHQSSFLKMCQESSNTISVKSDPNFERWVTKLRKDYSQRSKQAHLTNDNGFSFWPTVRASDDEGGIPSNVELSNGSFSRTNADGVRWGVKLKNAASNWTTPLADDTGTRKNKFAQGGSALSYQANNWPTPRQRDHKDGMASTTSLVNGKFVRTSNTTGTKYGAGLDGAAANWPTPNTMDDIPPRSEEGTKKLFSGARKGRTKPSNLREFVHEENWPTPTTQEIAHEDMEVNEKNRREPKYGKTSYSLNLQDRSRSWPTPTVAEADKIGNRPNYGQKGLSNHPAIVGKVQREKMTKSKTKDGKSTNPDISSIHQDPMTQKDGHTCSVSCRRLNPLFAEHLMGLPLGWTCVSEPLEMELYQQWQQELSSFLYRN